MIHAFKTSKEDRFEIAFHIKQGKNLKQVSHEVEIVHVNSERNYVAHLLVQLACRNMHYADRLKQVPTCIAQQVALDCNVSLNL